MSKLEFIWRVFLIGLQRELVLANLSKYPDVSVLKLRMNNAVSKRHDDYVCSAQKLDDTEAFIVRFEPTPDTNVPLHMNMNGCEEPYSDEPYWNCNETSQYCKGSKRYFIYVWAENGTAKTLPEGTGYQIGGKTKIKYIVISMHYKDRFKDGQTDRSGFNIYITHRRLPFQIGYYQLKTGGHIPAMTQEFRADTGCQYKSEDVIYPILFRTHSHNLGYLTVGYRIRNGTWTEIGRMSPQLPQSFYDVTTQGVDIRRGDYLVARCYFKSNRTYVTEIGSTNKENKDEMCIFYIIYYTQTINKAMKMTRCFKNHHKFHLQDKFKNVPGNIGSIIGIPSFKMHADPYLNDVE